MQNRLPCRSMIASPARQSSLHTAVHGTQATPGAQITTPTLALSRPQRPRLAKLSVACQAPFAKCRQVRLHLPPDTSTQDCASSFLQSCTHAQLVLRSEVKRHRQTGSSTLIPVSVAKLTDACQAPCTTSHKHRHTCELLPAHTLKHC